MFMTKCNPNLEALSPGWSETPVDVWNAKANQGKTTAPMAVFIHYGRITAQNSRRLL